MSPASRPGPSQPLTQHYLRSLPRHRGFALALVIATFSFASPWIGIGYAGPRSLLSSGERGVLQAPTGDFERELQRLRLEPADRLVQPPLAGSVRSVTGDAEIADLTDALHALNYPTGVVAQLLLEFSGRRADVEAHRAALDRWRSPDPWTTKSSEGTEPRPTFEWRGMPPEIPAEFELYLRGAAAWHDGQTHAARTTWSQILERPAAERSRKSTWATFMLGRSWHEEDPERALSYYSDTRRLAHQGMSDRAGLAIASLGWEAQLHLRAGNVAKALRLYLDQYAAGSTRTSIASLEQVVRTILQGPAEQRLEIARNPVFRQVITAWILSRNSRYLPRNSAGENDAFRALAQPWLDTVQDTGAADVALAEQMAVLAYQAQAWESAESWIELSGDSPAAAWIGAKLLVRSGHRDDAIERYETIVRRLPLQPDDLEADSDLFIDSLSISTDRVSARRAILAELGALQVARGSYVQGLDALLRAGFWPDAAYVAEQVLDADELRSYVERAWPAPANPGEVADEDDPDALLRDTWQKPAAQSFRIRHLLARRLTRLSRGSQALPFFPAQWRPVQTRLLRQLGIGEDQARPAWERAEGWFAAACLIRTNGLELMGTELEPDWAIWEGNYTDPSIRDARAETTSGPMKPTPDELRRAKAHRADPESRFHYRYHAALIAWEGASLLPDNDPETARLLYWGGHWVKDRSPVTADLFYKALVRRCRATLLGRAADELRWFPALDAEGNPRNIPPFVPSAAEEDPENELDLDP